MDFSTVAAIDTTPITDALSEVGPAAAVVLAAGIAVSAGIVFGLKLFHLAKASVSTK